MNWRTKELTDPPAPSLADLASPLGVTVVQATWPGLGRRVLGWGLAEAGTEEPVPPPSLAGPLVHTS